MGVIDFNAARMRPMTRSSEEAARESRQDVLDAIGEIVIARDAGGRITFVNAAFRRAFGGSLRDWVGRWFAVGPGGGASALSSGGRRRFEGHLETVAGPASVEWEETPLADGGVIAVGRDMSRRSAGEEALRIAREAAEAAARAKETVFATVTHELRTPLNGVLGMADLLEKTGLTPEQTAYVRAMRESGRHLLGLVDDVLDAAKLEAGAVVLCADEIDVRALVQDVAELVAPRARARGLDVAVRVGAGTPRLVSGDPARLRQILLNLAGNAVKFTDEGAVSVEVDLEATSGAGAPARLVFRVRDTGPGVAPDDQKRIFEAFAQADGTTARRVEGAGLGLAIVARLVAAMDGETSLESAVGAGAVFSVSLPLPILEPEDQSALLRGVTALVVSDRPLAGDALTRQLRSFGAQVGLVTCAQDAARALQTAPECVVLADAPLAADLADAVAGARGAIVLAAPDERDQLGDHLANGYHGWLVKPVRPTSMAEQVARVWLNAPALRSGSVTSPTSASPARARSGDAATLERKGGPVAPSKGLHALSVDQSGPADLSAPSSVPVSPSSVGPRVLLVEDNPVNTLLARTLLTRLGADVATAADGRAAVAAAQATRFDLILMDMRLPGLDGLAATRALRLAGASSSAPVVALTANAGPDDRAACHAAGMNDFLSKPVDEAALRAVMARWTQAETRATSP